MKAELIKLGIIERLMKVQSKDTLQRMYRLLIQAEMEANAEESLKSIDRGDVLSLDEMKNANKKWAKENYLK